VNAAVSLPTLPAAGDVAALVRLPAVLTVPGDGWLGAATAGVPMGSRSVVLAGASACLYLSGMALNDWADREVDARERPRRPIPSGRVTPGFALTLAAGLSAGGLALAGLAGGKRALAVAVPLAGAVWSYDLAVKGTPAGPLGMAACRSLDVLLGAAAGTGPGRMRRALPAAGIVGAHTAVVTTVSRREAQGAGPGLAGAALAACTAVTGAAAALARGRVRDGRTRGLRRAAAGGLLGLYAGTIARAGGRAVAEPSPARLQELVGTGVLALMPLEAGLLAAAGPVPAAAAVAGAWPLARRLARRRPVT
jgi:4-hydroxybenzoate polyprenyltransferase